MHICIVIIVLFLIVCLFSGSESSQKIKYIKPQDNHDHAYQIFTHDKSAKRWNIAHGAMYKDLSSNPYVTFDLIHKANPKLTVLPDSIDQIKQIVLDNKSSKIRASGGHHTFSTISLSDDIVLRTFNLKKVLSLDKDKMQITIESGMLLHELNAYLRDNGLALPILPAIPWQCVGGALATSTHGSVTNRGSMSSLVVNVTMVLSDGYHKTFSAKDKEFEAVVTGLGCLGIVYSVTLRCVPAFAIKHTTKMLTLNEFKKEINDNKNRAKFAHMQGYIYPKIKGKNVKTYYREIITKFDSSTLPLDVKTDGTEKESKKYKAYKDKGRIDWSDDILVNNQEAGFYTEVEVAVNLKDWSHAVDDVIKLYFEHEKKYDYVSGWPILVRFTMRDDSLLSMTSDRDSVFLDVFNTRSKAKDENLINYFNNFEEMLINKYKGRPHYGKRNNLTIDIMKKLYGTNVDKFNKIRKELDPKGMFSNDYIDQILGKVK